MFKQKWLEVFIFNFAAYFISILFNIILTCGFRACLYTNLLSIKFWLNRVDFFVN